MCFFVIYWKKLKVYLYKCPNVLFILSLGGQTAATTGDILSFFTGADNIPPQGLGSATLTFNDSNVYPTASTCGLCLTLPTMYNDYASFRDKFIFAMLNHGGFGLY